MIYRNQSEFARGQKMKLAVTVILLLVAWVLR